MSTLTPAAPAGRPGLTLRTAQPADSALIASMHGRSWATAYRGMLPDTYLDHEMTGERLAYWQGMMADIAAGAGQVSIAEHAGEPVAFSCVLRPDAQGSVLVDQLHALPQFKGVGAGTALLDAARQWAREQGARGLHLFVLDTNHAAIGFYESRGWRRSAREDKVLGGNPVVAYRYEMPLD